MGGQTTASLTLSGQESRNRSHRNTDEGSPTPFSGGSACPWGQSPQLGPAGGLAGGAQGGVSGSALLAHAPRRLSLGVDRVTGPRVSHRQRAVCWPLPSVVRAFQGCPAWSPRLGIRAGTPSAPSVKQTLNKRRSSSNWASMSLRKARRPEEATEHSCFQRPPVPRQATPHCRVPGGPGPRDSGLLGSSHSCSPGDASGNARPP